MSKIDVLVSKRENDRRNKQCLNFTLKNRSLEILKQITNENDTKLE